LNGVTDHQIIKSSADAAAMFNNRNNLEKKSFKKKSINRFDHVIICIQIYLYDHCDDGGVHDGDVHDRSLHNLLV